MDTLSRESEFRSSTPSTRPTAMREASGDQMAWVTSIVAPALAVRESHEIGISATRFETGGLMYCSYSFRTTDDWGASRSAEW